MITDHIEAMRTVRGDHNGRKYGDTDWEDIKD